MTTSQSSPDFDPEEGAAQLAHAERTRRGITPFSSQFTDFTTEHAWLVAAHRDRMRGAAGDVHVGYKLGWTSDAMRQKFGIQRPNFGALWESMKVEREIKVADFLHPKAEPELAFLAGADLDEYATTTDIMESGKWAVAIEVVDPRWSSYNFDWRDNTADGSSAAAFITGSFKNINSDLSAIDVTLQYSGAQSTGHGRAALGSPVEAVAFLLTQLGRSGERIRQGEVVLTGGLTPPVDLEPRTTVRVTSSKLQPVELLCS